MKTIWTLEDGTIVHVEKGNTGLWFATSPNIRGLLVAKHTLDELKVAIPGAIAELNEARQSHRGGR